MSIFNLVSEIKRKLTKGRKPKNHDPNNHSLQRLKGKRIHIKSGAGNVILLFKFTTDSTVSPKENML